jgi:hypothetical protein
VINNLSFPFGFANAFATISLMDQYRDVLSEFFTYTAAGQQCFSSSIQPEVDETVLHTPGLAAKTLSSQRIL